MQIPGSYTARSGPVNAAAHQAQYDAGDGDLAARFKNSLIRPASPEPMEISGDSGRVSVPVLATDEELARLSPRTREMLANFAGSDDVLYRTTAKKALNAMNDEVTAIVNKAALKATKFRKEED